MPTATRTPRCKYCTDEGTIFKNSEWRCERHDVTIAKLDGILGIESYPAASLREYLIDMAERNLYIETDFRDRDWVHLTQNNDLGKMRLGTIEKYETAEKKTHGRIMTIVTVQLRDVLGQAWTGYCSLAKLGTMKLRPLATSFDRRHVC